MEFGQSKLLVGAVTLTAILILAVAVFRAFRGQRKELGPSVGEDQEVLQARRREEVGASIRAMDNFSTWLIVGNVGALLVLFQAVLSQEVLVTALVRYVGVSFVVGAIAGGLAKIRAVKIWDSGVERISDSTLFGLWFFLSLGALIAGTMIPLFVDIPFVPRQVVH